MDDGHKNNSKISLEPVQRRSSPPAVEWLGQKRLHLLDRLTNLQIFLILVDVVQSENVRVFYKLHDGYFTLDLANTETKNQMQKTI